MKRWTNFLIPLAWLMTPMLPLCGIEKGGKDKEDALIAAMKFVKIPKGTFWMSQYEKNAQVKVEIKADFELAAYTVTQEQWEAVMGKNPSYFSRNGDGKDKVKDISDEDLKRFPVESVSYKEVQVFLQKLNDQQEGKGWVYRLPTEAEWEYACRNASTSKEDCSFDFYFDKGTNDLSAKQANFRSEFPAGKGEKGPGLGRPTKVGSYAPNMLGLYDMHGNVWQWTDHAKGMSVIFIRGGGWLEKGPNCRASSFVGMRAQQTASLRLARVPSSAK